MPLYHVCDTLCHYREVYNCTWGVTIANPEEYSPSVYVKGVIVNTKGFFYEITVKNTFIILSMQSLQLIFFTGTWGGF